MLLGKLLDLSLGKASVLIYNVKGTHPILDLINVNPFVNMLHGLQSHKVIKA